MIASGLLNDDLTEMVMPFTDAVFLNINAPIQVSGMQGVGALSLGGAGGMTGSESEFSMLFSAFLPADVPASGAVCGNTCGNRQTGSMRPQTLQTLSEGLTLLMTRLQKMPADQVPVDVLHQLSDWVRQLQAALGGHGAVVSNVSLDTTPEQDVSGRFLQADETHDHGSLEQLTEMLSGVMSREMVRPSMKVSTVSMDGMHQPANVAARRGVAPPAVLRTLTEALRNMLQRLPSVEHAAKTAQHGVSGTAAELADQAGGQPLPMDAVAARRVSEAATLQHGNERVSEAPSIGQEDAFRLLQKLKAVGGLLAQRLGARHGQPVRLTGHGSRVPVGDEGLHVTNPGVSANWLSVSALQSDGVTDQHALGQGGMQTVMVRPEQVSAQLLRPETILQISRKVSKVSEVSGRLEEAAQAGDQSLTGGGTSGAVRSVVIGGGREAIHLPLRHPQWGEALAQRVMVLAQNNQQLARIRLHPAHLGPIQVKLKMDADSGVQVSLHAHHVLTREAIEQAVPRLRELFQQQGLSLTDVTVQPDARGHAQAFADARRQQADGGSSFYRRGSRMEIEPEEDHESGLSVRMTHGLVDHFV